MRLRLTAPEALKQQLIDMVDSYDAVVESIEHAGAKVSLVTQVSTQQPWSPKPWAAAGFSGLSRLQPHPSCLHKLPCA